MSLPENFNVWEGIFSSFDEAGGDDNVFNDLQWLERSRDKAVALREHHASASIATQDYSLPMLAAIFAASSNRLRILDFGGALGFSFFPVRACLSDSVELTFDIVEQPAMVQVGRELFGDEHGLSFYSDLGEVDVSYDIVHAGSSLQYVRCWKQIIARLCDFNATYFAIDDIPAGNIDSYVSLQNYYGNKIPCWFWNKEEFIACVQAHAYDPIFQTQYVSRILGKTGPFPMENFPEDRRISNPLNVIFQKRK